MCLGWHSLGGFGLADSDKSVALFSLFGLDREFKKILFNLYAILAVYDCLVNHELDLFRDARGAS